jgi:CTP:phosphocholine cytidylyltransferase-like protein
VGEYIDRLFLLFRYDSDEIFNIKSDIKILETIEEMKVELPEKYWENVLRKCIKKTNIRKRDEAFNNLKELAGMNR